MMSESPIARIVLNIMHRVNGGHKNKPQEVVVMEKVEIPPNSIDQKSAAQVKAVLDKFECMPDFVPSGKELFGIDNIAYPVKKEKRANKISKT